MKAARCTVSGGKGKEEIVTELQISQRKEFIEQKRKT
jgi:hypothetical protein